MKMKKQLLNFYTILFFLFILILNCNSSNNNNIGSDVKFLNDNNIISLLPTPTPTPTPSSNITIIQLPKENLVNIFLSKNGDDTNGNGTIESPYFSICKVVESIDFYQINEDNNFIKVFIEPGLYKAIEGCVLNIFDNTIVSLIFYNTTSTTTTTTTTVESTTTTEPTTTINLNSNLPTILNLNLNIVNSSLILNNINFLYNNYDSTFQFLIENSNLHSNFLNFTNSHVLFAGIANELKSPSNITIKNSNVVHISFGLNNKILLIDKSNLVSVTFDLNASGVEGGGGIEEYLYFSRSTFNNTLIYYREGCQNVFIDHCVMIYDFSYNIQVFLMFPNNTLTITDTLMQSTGEFFTCMINSNGSSVSLVNVTFTNWYLLRPFISVSGDSNFTLNNVVAANKMFIPAFIEISDSTLSIDDLKISGNKLVLINIEGPSFISISNLILEYQAQQGSPILMNFPGGYGEKTTIDIINSYFINVDGFTLRNADIRLINVTMSSFSIDSLFQLSSSFLMAVNSTFSSSMILGSYYLFSLEQTSSTYLESCLLKDSSLLFQAYTFSNVTVSNCIFDSLFSKEVAIDIQSHSSMEIRNSTIKNAYSVSSSFIYASSSTITITDCIFYQISLGFKALGSFYDSSNLVVNNLYLSNSFFQNQIFVADASTIYIDDSTLFNNSIYGSEMIYLLAQSYLSMSNSIITDNAISIGFSTSLSSANIHNVTFSSNSGVFLYSNQSTITLSLLQFSKNPISSLMYLLYFTNSTVSLTNVIINDNYFMGSVIEAHFSFIKFIDFQFFNNENVDNLLSDRESPSLSFTHCTISLVNSTISSNLQWSLDLISILKSDLLLNNTKLINNSIPYDGYLIRSVGSFVVIDQSLISNTQSIEGTLGLSNCLLNLTNSQFINNNILHQGGALQLVNTITPLLLNNTFINNNASIGGAIFTDGFLINTNSTQFLSNYFNDNNAVFGDNIGSFPTSIQVEYPNDFDSTLNLIYLYDNYTNLVSDNFYMADIIVVQLDQANNDQDGSEVVVINNNNQTLSKFTSFIRAGVGSFNYSFNVYLTSFQVIVSILADGYNITYNEIIFSPPCLPFQSNTPENGCSFCPINQATSPSKEKCETCDNSKLICLDSQVYTLPDYYMLNNDVTLTYECSIGICFGNNTCKSDVYLQQSDSSPLCSRCINDPILGYPPSESKNGLHCCHRFEILLIIPYVLFMIGFGLLLSLFKHVITGSFIGILIIYLQSNAIIFHSFSGLYILPLFRLSIDFIDGFCMFKINYFHKVCISLGTIIFVYLLGISNISPKLFKKLPKSIIPNIIKRQLKKHKELNQIMTTTTTTTSGSSPSSRSSSIITLRYCWNIYLMLLQPLLFNLISLIIPKKLDNTLYLQIDLSILFLTTRLQKVFFYISIVILFLIIIIIPLIVFLNCFCFPSSKFKINLIIYSGIFKNSYHFKKYYKWYDLVFIYKSILYTFISIQLLYNPTLCYSLLVIIQTALTLIQFILYPQKKYSIFQIENLSNLFQLCLVIIVNTSIIKTVTYYLTGVLISSIILATFLIIIIYYFISISRRKRNNKNSKINNNNNNSNNLNINNSDDVKDVIKTTTYNTTHDNNNNKN